MFISLKILWYNRNVVLNNINYICRSFKIKQLVLTNQLHYAKENAIFFSSSDADAYCYSKCTSYDFQHEW